MTATTALDHTCRTRTAFASFQELVEGTHPSYRPSIEQSSREMIALADAYDDAMRARGDARRAYRYGSMAVEAYGVKGAASKQWRKTFPSSEALLNWCEKNGAVMLGFRDVEVTV